MVAQWKLGTRTMVAFLFGGWILLSGLLFHNQLPLNRASSDTGKDGRVAIRSMGLRALRSETLAEPGMDADGGNALELMECDESSDNRQIEKPSGSETGSRQLESSDNEPGADVDGGNALELMESDESSDNRQIEKSSGSETGSRQLESSDNEPGMDADRGNALELMKSDESSDTRQIEKPSGSETGSRQMESSDNEPNHRPVESTDELVQQRVQRSDSEDSQAVQVSQMEEEEEEGVSKLPQLPAVDSSSQRSLFPSAHVDKLRERTQRVQRYDDGIRLLIVTGEQASSCESKHGSHLVMKAYKNKQDYCMLHGCRVWYSLELYDERFRGVWARYPLLQRLMRVFPDIEWFLWMDADAIFTDMSFSIPLLDYTDRHMVVPGWPYLLFKENDWAGGLNAGVFLIRNSEWSYQFLERWVAMGQKDVQEELTKIFNEEFPTRPKHWPADDQCSLAHMIRANEHNESQYLLLETRYILHGFWEAIVDRYEGMLTADWDEKSSGWPFVSHFCGCKLCVVDDDSEYVRRCIHNFDRAYHFADDQILALTNARHMHLNTSRLVSTMST